MLPLFKFFTQHHNVNVIPVFLPFQLVSQQPGGICNFFMAEFTPIPKVKADAN